MDYDYGDILDARNAPGIEHFILVVGETSKKGKTEVMYFLITSRVYAVFKSIIAYFNDCLSRGDRNFLRFFNKEKGKAAITPHGLLYQAVFLDKDAHYPTCLDVDSMVVVNSDPDLIDKTALETLRNNGTVVYKNKLAKFDALKLRAVISLSGDVSPDRKNKIGQSFNLIKSTLR